MIITKEPSTIVELNPKPAFDMRVGATKENVMLIFSEAVTAAKLTPCEALNLAGLLIKHATFFVDPKAVISVEKIPVEKKPE